MNMAAEALLEELADELKGTLHVIAHAAHASDLDFIRGRQAYFRERYGHIVDDNVYRIVSREETAVEIAYANFMHVLDHDCSNEEIAENCEDILFDYLI